MTQLVVNTIYMNIVDRNMAVYKDPMNGKATRMINPTRSATAGIRKFFDVKVDLFICLLPHQASRF
jgi:hypothetical protein